MILCDMLILIYMFNVERVIMSGVLLVTCDIKRVFLNCEILDLELWWWFEIAINMYMYKYDLRNITILCRQY